MDDLFVVFDKIPTKKDGGLVATYVDFVRELSSEYNIKFVSIFRSEPTDIPAFMGLESITLFDIPLDNRFYHAPSLLVRGKVREAGFALVSALRFFSRIPASRRRTRMLLEGKKVVAVAPAAAMFLSPSVRYILEIHTSFGYFWGNGLLGRAQASMIPPAALTVFRNKSDARKGSELFPSTYMYNTFDGAGIEADELPSALTHRAVFVGRLAESKNPLMLLECARRVRERFEDFTLDVFGDGEMRAQIEGRILEMGLDGVVNLHGFTDDKSVYQGHDLLWLTSKYEGFGLVIIEAAANMVPTVTTDWGEAVSEVILDGQTGFIADDLDEFVDKSCEVMASLELRNRLARNARDDYEQRFSPTIHKAQWLRIINSVYPSEGAC